MKTQATLDTILVCRSLKASGEIGFADAWPEEVGDFLAVYYLGLEKRELPEELRTVDFHQVDWLQVGLLACA